MNLRLLACLFILLFCGRSHALLSPELAVQLLYGESHETYHDAAGYSYRVFRVSDSAPLQVLIDTVTNRLLQTSVGRSLCREVLNADWQLLTHHLAMSHEAAQTSATQCAQLNSRSSYVYDNPLQTPRKLTLNGMNSPRRYLFIVTDRPDLPLDSWTDAYTNQTTLFLHNSAVSSDLNLRYLTQTVAHELAIYFDAKSWPKGPGWNSIPQLASTRIESADLKITINASLNPTLATVLAFIRAHKLERLMVREILNRGLLGVDPLLYSQQDYPFMHYPCRVECLSNFIADQEGWISLFQPTLLAFSPHYRSQRLEILRSQRSHQALPDSLVDALERFPVYFFGRMNSNLVALNLIARVQDPLEREMHQAINQTMEQMLKADLNTLREASIQVTQYDEGVESTTEYDLLTYLTHPLLSDANIGLAAGPRPRIRTWGTK
ncbi:MAG: hypothetical protein AB7N80_11220 [Bdellovibrionales bacterium]